MTDKPTEPPVRRPRPQAKTAQGDGSQTAAGAAGPPPAASSPAAAKRGGAKKQTAAAPAPRPVSAQELGRVVGGAHHDPHSILGAHLHDGRLTVRALRRPSHRASSPSRPLSPAGHQ